MKKILVILLAFSFFSPRLKAQETPPEGLEAATHAFISYCHTTPFEDFPDGDYPAELFAEAPFVAHHRENPERLKGDFSNYPDDHEKHMLIQAKDGITRTIPKGVGSTLKYHGSQNGHDGPKVFAFEVEPKGQKEPIKAILAFILLNEQWVLVDID